MKKMLVLALVLAVAGLANAGYGWSVLDGATNVVAQPDGSFKVAAGSLLTLKLVATGTTLNERVNAINVNLITDNGASGMITGVTTNAAWAANGQDGMDAKAFDELLVGAGMDSLGLVAGDWAQLDRFGTGDAPANPNAIVTITYLMGGNAKINGAGLEVLGGFNYVHADGNPLPVLNLMIPEPMTMALLALGGLFIRRK